MKNSVNESIINVYPQFNLSHEQFVCINFLTTVCMYILFVILTIYLGVNVNKFQIESFVQLQFSAVDPIFF